MVHPHPNLPESTTLRRALKQWGLGERAADPDIERGDLEVFRLSPGGWRRVELREFRRWLRSLAERASSAGRG